MNIYVRIFVTTSVSWKTSARRWYLSVKETRWLVQRWLRR